MRLLGCACWAVGAGLCALGCARWAVPAGRYELEERSIRSRPDLPRSRRYELEERSIRSESLAARVGELQAALARRTETIALEAEAARERELTELRTEHQLQLAALGEEHEAATRRTLRRAQRAQQAATSLIPRQHARRVLALCFGALRAYCGKERELRQMRTRFDTDEVRTPPPAAAASSVGGAAAASSIGGQACRSSASSLLLAPP